MERVCALALCMLLSLCSATSPPRSPILTPLNCNETKHAELAADLINEDRDEGFLIRPFRTKSIYEQKLQNVPGSSLYYIDFEAKETKCSVLSGKKSKDCNEYISFYEEVTGECKGIMYISRPLRILKILHYNCTLGTVPARRVHSRCPDCPIVSPTITPEMRAKAEHMVEQFNKDSNQTNYFKLDEIERVITTWMFGWSYSISLTIKETDCLKTQKDVILDNCKSLEDHKAHVGFCRGRAYFTNEKKEEYTVSCEIYNPRPDDDDHHHHHHHKHGTCNQGKEGAQVEESKDNAGHSETGAEVGPDQAGADAPGPQERCGIGKRKHCGHHRGHRHHCHPGHHHHHSGHHHHHPGRHHHHHHDHQHHDHDHRNHSHPHDGAHHQHHHHDHHNHTSPEHGSSSEETTDKQPFKRTKGSVQVYYPDEETSSIPVPTILWLPKPGKHITEIADFPNEPSPLETCPSPPNSKSS